MIHVDRTPSEWFTEAARCYLEHHQGCAWCGGSYRVYQIQRGQRTEYFCNGCDFQATFDSAENEFFAVPGEKHSPKQPDTMYDV